MVRFLLIFLLLFNNSAISQNQKYVFKTIDINDGLSQNSVVDIVEDPTGFLWFATQDGLNRFDGHNFLVFPIAFDDITTPDNAQLGKLQVHDNKIWMIKKGGKIDVLDLFTQEINEFRTAGRNNRPLPPVSDLLIDSREGLWMGTLDQGLYYQDKNKLLHNYRKGSNSGKNIINNRVRSVFEDSRENIWVLTHGGVTKISGNISEDHLDGVNTNVFTEAPDRKLWIGSLGSGVFYTEPESEQFRPFRGYGNKKLPEDLVVEAIYADTRNRIWVGTYGNGLYIIDTRLQDITHLLPDRDNSSALNFQDILSVIEDRNGGIWLGSDGGGINYYNRQFNNFKKTGIEHVDNDISIEQIRAITTDDDGLIWLGTSGQGLTSFDPVLNKYKTFHLEPFKKGIANYDRIVSLQVKDSGDLWLGTQGNGLLIMDMKTGDIKKWFTTEAAEKSSRIPDNTIWSILPAQGDRMWAATRDAGLLLLDEEQGLIKEYKLPFEEGKEDRNVQCIIRLDPYRLALGYEEKGVHILDLSTGNFKPVTNPVIENTLEGATGIKSLFYEDNWLWIGTAGRGVIITNLISGKTRVLNDKEWLPNNMIYGMLPEKKGAIWMSSNKGIFRLVYRYSSNAVEIQQIFPYNVDHGLQSNEFNTGAYHRSEDGHLYFGGISGLNFFHPKDIRQNQKHEDVVLTGAMIGNKPMESDTVITHLKQLNLSHQENSLSFNYTLLDYISPDNLHYQYKLEGYDQNWQDAGNRNYTAYTNLPPNDYTFKVKVSDKISEAAPITSLDISIAAPFYLQWWFLMLLTMVTATFIYGLHRYRVYQLLQVQKVKNNIAADLHDDLGARLTNIHFLTAISRKTGDSGGENFKYLKEIEEEVEASSKSLDEIVWNINMDDESLQEIIAKMRKYAGEALERELEYHIDIKGKFRKKKMSMQKRRELFLVYKELLNNIRKHARATKVKINILARDEIFFMEIEDNGRGFNPRKKYKRNGLRNIKERVKKWNGTLTIKSEKNRGTLVNIQIPFDNWWSSVW